MARKKKRYGVGRFEHRDDYITKALTDPRIRKIIYKKTLQGFHAFRARTKVGSNDPKVHQRGPGYRPGSNRDKSYFEVSKGGRRGDRPVGVIEAFSDHAARREFGPRKDIVRGALYKKPKKLGDRDPAEYYKRKRWMRAKRYGSQAEHLLGGRWGRKVAYDGRPAIVNQIKR